jgi:hypothetical protein
MSERHFPEGFLWVAVTAWTIKPAGVFPSKAHAGIAPSSQITLSAIKLYHL